MKQYFYLGFIVFLGSCLPKEKIEFRKVQNIRFEMLSKSPGLKADLVLFNPNNTSGKLKSIKLDIFVNDKKAGDMNQTFDQKINGKEEFTVPVEVSLALKELGLFDALVNILGAKKQTVRLSGSVKVTVHGVRISIPIEHKEDMKVKL